MDAAQVFTVGQQALYTLLTVAAPVLLVVLIVGILVSIFQAATQINEQTLSFIPKLIGVFIALVLAGPWMITVMTDYMRNLFSGIPQMIG